MVVDTYVSVRWSPETGRQHPRRSLGHEGDAVRRANSRLVVRFVQYWSSPFRVRLNSLWQLTKMHLYRERSETRNRGVGTPSESKLLAPFSISSGTMLRGRRYTSSVTDDVQRAFSRSSRFVHVFRRDPARSCSPSPTGAGRRTPYPCPKRPLGACASGRNLRQWCPVLWLLYCRKQCAGPQSGT